MLSYWEKRSLERLALAEANSISHLKKIKSVYRQASKDTVNEIKKLYTQFYGRNGFDTKELNKLAKISDLKRLKRKVNELGLELPKNYEGRLTRLELIDAQLWERSKEIASKEQLISTNSYKETIENSYYHSIYDLSKGMKENIAFSTLDDKTINKILNTKFYGENYSKRIWDNTDKLADNLQSILGKAIATGQAPYKTIKQVVNEFGTQGKPKQAFYNAERLIRTETNYFQNKAEIEAYDEVGLEKYEFVATLDDRTSEICQEHDGKIFDIKTAVEGEDIPPLHPNCRSTIAPYVEGFEPETRIARNPETGKNYLVQNMNYEEWRKTIVNDEENYTNSYYANNIGVSLKYWNKEMTADERWFVRNFDGNIKWIPKFAWKNGKLISTNDFIFNGKQYELKTPQKKIKYKSISNMIKKDVSKGKKDFVISFKNKKIPEKIVKQLENYNINNPDNRIRTLHLFNKEKQMVKINLKKSR